MLLRLEIKNFVLIESATLEFCPSLNVITGETGAGKSLILSSLEACLGSKVSAQQVLTGQTNATVTCVLENVPHVCDQLKSLGFPVCEEIILRREISRDGRSRCFINDTYCSISTAKSIGVQLIDIHGQHAYHSLLNPHTQRDWLDSFANVSKELQEYKTHYKEWAIITKKISDLLQKKQSAKIDKEYTNFCIQELQQGLIQQSHYDATSLSITSLEKQKKSSHFATMLFDFFSQQASGLEEMIKKGDTLGQENPDLITKLQALLLSVNEIKDITEAMPKPSEEQIDQNIDNLHSLLAKADRLKRKYERPLKKLWEMLADLQSSLHTLENFDEVLHDLEEKKSSYQEICTALALNIRLKRQQMSILFCNEMKEKIAALGMLHSVFTVVFEPLQNFSESGLDHVEFYYSPSEKISPKKLQSVASGGELSRISLALHCVLGRKKPPQTLFFDEIDTGIGGESALHMGKLLEQLSERNQIILITHVAQVAKFSQKHFLVQKKSPETSHIQTLSPEQKIKEIARMIRGDSFTQEDLLFAQRFIIQP